MGNKTSSPLVSSEELSGETENASHHEDNHVSHHSESCWIFLVRKIYNVFGLDYQPLQDTSSSTRRKRKISEVESPSESEIEQCNNCEDVERANKTPRLTEDSEDSNNLHSKEDKDLEQQNVNVSIVTETMEHSVRANGVVSDDVRADPMEVEIKDVVPTATTPVEFMDFPFLTDEEARHYLSRSWTMFIIRGLAGSGKSTIVRQLEETYPSSVSCSADQFFLNTRTGEYQFDRSLLGEAHKWCQSRAEEACRARANVVIVDNTNVKRWEMVPYFKLADRYRYSVVLVEPRTPWRFNIDELARRNRHGVDRLTLSKKVKDWQSVRSQYYGWFLSLLDSRLLLERAREVLQQCLSLPDICQEVGRRTGYQRVEDVMALYSRENINSGEKCHCTAQFVRKSEVEQEQHPVETERLGEVSRLTIAGFILTPRTFGARVVLSQSQLELYKQNDLEPFSLPPRPGQNSQPSRQPRPQLDWDHTEVGSLEDSEWPGLDMVGDVKGRRAHITLGCVGPVRPVQTGVDQLEVLRRLEKCQHQDSATIQAGHVVSLGEGCWAVTLNTPLSVASLFTGSY